jgi:hypothetical protein
MTKTLIALDEYFSWGINLIHGIIAGDIQNIFNNEWAIWTVIPAFLWAIITLVKNSILFAIVFSPFLLTLGKLIRGFEIIKYKIKNR